MKQQFIKSTILVMAATTLLKSLGFVREVSLAAAYGAGAVTDAFVVAFTSPNVLLAFVSSAAAAVYIPMYQSNKERKDLFTGNIVNLLILFGLAFSLVFALFPEALVFIFASQLDAETFEMAAMMTRIMVLSAAPILLLSIYRSYLEIHGAFFVSHIAYAAVNVSIIATIFLSKSAQHLPLLGIGAVAGNLLCVGILFTTSRAHGLSYRPYLNLRDSSVKDMLMLALPVMLATGIGEINQIVDRNFASSLPAGAISSLNYALKVVSLASMLIGTAVATVLFPKMSELAAGDNYAHLKKYLLGSAGKLVPVLLPLTAGTVLLAEPITMLLFERGAFTPGDTQKTAQCLQMYAVCIVCSSLNVLLSRACHAMKDMKGPAISSGAAVIFNITMNFILIGPLAHRGLALSSGMAAVVMTVLLLMVLRRKLGPLGLFRELPEAGKALAATAVMSAAVWLGIRFLPLMSGGMASRAALTAALVFAGAALYMTLLIAMRSAFYADARLFLRSALSSKTETRKQSN